MRANVKTQDCEREENSKNVRMSLHVLQPAATDKENLVGPGRSANQGLTKEKLKVFPDDNKANESSSKASNKKKKPNRLNQEEANKKTVTANDLIGEPGEAYWKRLAETRRVALEEALQENEVLFRKVELLEKEKILIQDMLDEARSLIEVMNEVIGSDEINGGDNEED